MIKKKTSPRKKARATKKKTLSAAAQPRKKTAKKTVKKAKRQLRARAREISSGSERSSLGAGPFETSGRPTKRGLGTGAAGQSGDLQGLSRSIDVDSESVEELIEEGQAFEADAISGVENAPDADQGEVRVHERPEDELPIVDPEDR